RVGAVLTGRRIGVKSMATEASILEWFELEVSPHVFRLALVPDQPVLFGHGAEGDTPGAVYLVPTEKFPTQVARFRSDLLALLDASGVLSMPCAQPERTFVTASPDEAPAKLDRPAHSRPAGPRPCRAHVVRPMKVGLGRTWLPEAGRE